MHGHIISKEKMRERDPWQPQPKGVVHNSKLVNNPKIAEKGEVRSVDVEWCVHLEIGGGANRPCRMRVMCVATGAKKSEMANRVQHIHNRAHTAVEHTNTKGSANALHVSVVLCQVDKRVGI